MDCSSGSTLLNLTHKCCITVQPSTQVVKQFTRAANREDRYTHIEKMASYEKCRKLHKRVFCFVLQSHRRHDPLSSLVEA